MVSSFLKLITKDTLTFSSPTFLPLHWLQRIQVASSLPVSLHFVYNEMSTFVKADLCWENVRSLWHYLFVAQKSQKEFLFVMCFNKLIPSLYSCTINIYLLPSYINMFRWIFSSKSLIFSTKFPLPKSVWTSLSLLTVLTSKLQIKWIRT